METAVLDIVKVFKVLAEPPRLRIVQALTLTWKSVTLLVQETDLPQPLVSHHLRILRDSGIARAERRGAYTYYWLVDEAVWKTVRACAELVAKMRAAEHGS